MDPAARMRQPAVRTTIGILTATVLLVGATGTVSADHLPEVTAHCTYEVGEWDPPALITIDYAAPDPTGLTADGAINDTVCVFHTPDSDPGENSNLGPIHFFLDGVITIDGQYSVAQTSIVDDVFGSAIGGAMCADFNHDHICGSADDGEPANSFCGTSPAVAVGHDTDGNGHADFGWGLVVGVNGWYDQVLNCDPVAAPQSTTGGVLDPAGGIYVTVSG